MKVNCQLLKIEMTHNQTTHNQATLKKHYNKNKR